MEMRSPPFASATRPGVLEGAYQGSAYGCGLEAMGGGGDHELAEVAKGEVEIAMEVGQFLSHGRREEQWVVGADRDPHAGLVQRADRMRRHSRHETRLHVAGGADVEHHPGLRQ